MVSENKLIIEHKNTDFVTEIELWILKIYKDVSFY